MHPYPRHSWHSCLKILRNIQRGKYTPFLISCQQSVIFLLITAKLSVFTRVCESVCQSVCESVGVAVASHVVIFSQDSGQIRAICSQTVHQSTRQSVARQRAGFAASAASSGRGAKRTVSPCGCVSSRVRTGREAHRQSGRLRQQPCSGGARSAPSVRTAAPAAESVRGAKRTESPQRFPRKNESGGVWSSSRQPARRVGGGAWAGWSALVRAKGRARQSAPERRTAPAPRKRAPEERGGALAREGRGLGGGSDGADGGRARGLECA